MLSRQAAKTAVRDWLAIRIFRLFDFAERTTRGPKTVPATVQQRPVGYLPLTLLCSVCSKPISVKSFNEVWCSNPGCPIALDIYRVSLILYPVKEADNAGSAPS